VGREAALVTAENAVGLFALAVVAIAAGAHWLRRRWARASEPLDSEESHFLSVMDLAPEESATTDLATCPDCGEPLAICMAADPDYARTRSPWSGVDPRHGDDGNSGHG
jgi:hypothetical protein